MEAAGDPRPAGARQGGCASSAIRARAKAVERLEDYDSEHGIWDCTRCYFCNERCPKGVDPRDAIAKLGAESVQHGIDRDMGAKHAKWFVTSAKTTGWLRETELVPKTQGIMAAIKQTGSRSGSLKHGKVPLPVPPHVAKDVDEARALHELVKAQDRQGALGHRAGRAGARRGSSTGTRRRRATRTARARSRGHFSRREQRSAAGRHGQPTQADVTPAPSRRGTAADVKVAYYKGCLASLSAKELDISTQALAPMLGLELEELESVTCCGAGDIHEAEPDYYLHLNARILAYAEATGAETLMTICNVCTLNLRQANWQLEGRRSAARARERRTSPRSACHRTAEASRCKHFLWLDRRGRGLRAAQAGGAQGAEGPEGRAVLRLPDPAAVEAPRLRGSGPAVVARGDHRGVRRRGDRLSGEDQVLRLPDHPGA